MTEPTVARLVARCLVDRGVRRAYGLTGSHVKPIWDELVKLGVEIVDVRHEVAAVHMAHAAAEVTGALGVAIVTAGPGMTNAVTGIATAQHARAPVLVLSALPPRPQLGKGAFEEAPQRAIVALLCRYAATVWRPERAVDVVDRAIAAALGDGGLVSSGASYVDMPVDVLRSAPVGSAGSSAAGVTGSTAPGRLGAAPGVTSALAPAGALIGAARRPVVISGGGAKGAEAALQAFVERLGGLYLDTRETRGLLPLDLPAYVPAQRGRAMQEADLVITVGRRLDYELAYGSPAVFADGARFLRIGATAEHLRDNRAADVEVRGDVGLALTQLAQDLDVTNLDTDWVAELQHANRRRVEALTTTMAEHPPGPDGRMHPYRLLAAVNDVIDDDTIVTADGGDILSFAAVGLRARTFLTPGPFGCLGVGVPFAIAAAIECPTRRVIAVVGDGAFGFNAMEIDTAVRRKAPVVVVVANNEAWGIEDRDRIENYDDAPFNTRLPSCRYDLLARSLGAHGERVVDPAALDGALQRALANAPSVLDVAVTRDVISPDFANGLADLGDHHAVRSWNDLEIARLHASTPRSPR